MSRMETLNILSTGVGMTQADLYRFLSENKLGVLATVTRSGMPQSAVVGIAVSESLEIIFDTLSSSRKFENLKHCSRVSFVVGWDNEITLQYEGEAFCPTGEERAKYLEIYFGQWPDGPARLAWPGIAHVVVRPRWIRYSNFNASSRCIHEFDFSDSAKQVPEADRTGGSSHAVAIS